MSDTSAGKQPKKFDAYYRWLGIPPERQPPDYYQLLGLQCFEDNPDVIETAADRQSAHIRTYTSGHHAKVASKILNQIATARICLLKPESKQTYDDKLRAHRTRGQAEASQIEIDVDAASSAVRSRPAQRRATRKAPAAIAAVVVLIVCGAVIGYLAWGTGEEVAQDEDSSLPKSHEANGPSTEQQNAPNTVSDNDDPTEQTSNPPGLETNTSANNRPQDLATNVTTQPTTAGTIDEPPLVAPPQSNAPSSASPNSVATQPAVSTGPPTEIAGEFVVDMSAENLPIWDIPEFDTLADDGREINLEVLEIEGFETEVKGLGRARPGQRIVLTAPKEKATVEFIFHFRHNGTIKFTATAGGPGFKPIELSQPRIAQTKTLTQKNYQENSNELAGAVQIYNASEAALRRAVGLSNRDASKPAAVARCQAQLRTASDRVAGLRKINDRLAYRLTAMPFLEDVCERLHESKLRYRVALRTEAE